MELLLIPLLAVLYVIVGFFVTYFISGIVSEVPEVPFIPILAWPFSILFFGVYGLAVGGWKLVEKVVGKAPTPVDILENIAVKSFALGSKIRKKFGG